ncbi:MAG: hypothetical protein M3Z04_17900 [Chloroflexota bacterium]|nr:hypothetical protein [Chloroflexota bacterium]
MSRTAWIGTAVCGGIVGLAGLIAAGIPASQAAPNGAPCPPAWHLVAGPDTQIEGPANLNAVAASGPNDVWAVGERRNFSQGGGLAEHWDGARWTLTAGLGDTVPRAVAVPAPGDAWAVGFDIKRWDGSRWNVVPLQLDLEPQPAGSTVNYLLYGVAGTARDDVWAVGVIQRSRFPSGGTPPQEEALTIHWDGSRWSRVAVGDASRPQISLQALTMINHNDVWAAGYRLDTDAGQVPITLHWDGTRWTIITLAGTGDPPSIQALAAAGPQDVWLVGSQTHYVPLPPGTPPPYSQPQEQPLIEHWDGSRWSIVPGTGLGGVAGALRAVSARSSTDAWAVGYQGPEFRTLTLHWDGVHWTRLDSPNLTPNYDLLNGVVASGPNEVWAVGNSNGSNGTLRAWYSPECGLPTPNPSVVPVIYPTQSVLGTPPPPSDVVPLLTPPPGGNPIGRVADPHDPQGVYFPVVGHGITAQFYAYWRDHGGLAQFGYPLTEEFLETNPSDGRSYRVQYFERNRFEWHPENAAPYNVLLGLLGSDSAAGRMGDAPFRRVVAPAVVRYFAQTGHTLGAEFAAYWQDHGGLAVYGYPISEPFREVSPTDGQPYLVQYFQRNRLEYHPELPATYRVSLGLLGVDLLRARGWLP